MSIIALNSKYFIRDVAQRVFLKLLLSFDEIVLNIDINLNYRMNEMKER